ncbi:hypothetical protein ASG22_06815 [Chryseobacterium sp. Leaf405]|uniref:alpha/beta hydrolase family protein n=1 Tax=Chryseobacterium sp. Leaf405 TaxID=1736367 RepID=UPI0007023985|nr:prolyl oligopeptidase family serine peptidase [Chryseobacterium sp. Leaf405]KQT23744.1 hypothetical protein ASG22_06815 [Chryseobacterium sp. Leaf405]
MKATNIREILGLVLLLLLCLCRNVYAAKKVSDSADAVSYFTLGNLTASEGGRWSAVSKLYGRELDSLLVFDSRQKEIPVLKLRGFSTAVSFLNNHYLFVTGTGKAMLIDLTTQRRKEFNQLKQAGVLKDQKTFFILGSDKVLSVYDYDGVLLNHYSGINRVVTDKVKILIGISEVKTIGQPSDSKSDASSLTTVITDFSGKLPVELYRKDSKVERIQLTERQSYLMMTEKDRVKSEIQLLFIDVKTRERKSFFVGDSGSFLKLDVNELENGTSLWIDVWRKEVPGRTVPEIWYGNDGDLKAKRNGYITVHDYYLWKKKDHTPLKIGDRQFPIFASLQRTDQVLAFNPRVNFNYRTRVPLPTLYVYDVKHKISKAIFNHALETIAAGDGSSVISYNSEKDTWFFYDFDTDESIAIGGKQLKKPVYDSIFKNIFFESNEGFWKYDIRKRQLSVVKGTEGLRSSVLSSDQSSLNTEYHIYSRNLRRDQSLILSVRDENNQTAYGLYKNGRYTALLADTPNRISEIRLTKDQKMIYTIEENYNLPPRLFCSDSGSKKKDVIFAGNTADLDAKNIRQDIIRFSNSQDISLRGLLYYPVNYDATQKYPMIVHIYQIRSTDSNLYHHRGDDVGFDLRALLKKGYFVYLPDIVYGNKGAGRSALDCVDSALNALNAHPNINWKKLGLTGHSMGGYETNFIATQSNRFAAFISGSAHSDLIRNYFSYNYNTNIPQIWRIETGQYEMGVSFAEDKQRYFTNSPIHYVDQVKAPILLWTGKKDENVQWDQTMEFYMGLKRFDKKVIALFYESGDHTFYETPENNKDITFRSMEWWDYFLRDQKEVQWISKQMKKDAL